MTEQPAEQPAPPASIHDLLERNVLLRDALIRAEAERDVARAIAVEQEQQAHALFRAAQALSRFVVEPSWAHDRDVIFDARQTVERYAETVGVDRDA